MGSLCAFLVSDAARAVTGDVHYIDGGLHILAYTLRETTMTDTFSSSDLDVIRNRTFDEIRVGDRASIERTLTAADIQVFAALSGDVNPQHIDAEFAASTALPGRDRARHVGSRAHLGGARHPAARAPAPCTSARR